MQWRNSPDRYGAVVQGTHWVTVILILLAWLLGQFMDDIPRGAARTSAHWLHNEAGMLVMILLAVRLGWRLIDASPAEDRPAFGALGEYAGKLAHLALYALMLAVPIAGIVLVFARGRGLDLFGLVEIASPWTRDPAFAEQVEDVHGWLANALIVLACVHAVAALAHHWVLRDSTLQRMLPGRAR